MRVLLDIKDNKADFVMELLNSFPFIKTESITPTEAQFISELKGAVEEVSLAKKGKVKLQSAREFLNEL